METRIPLDRRGRFNATCTECEESVRRVSAKRLAEFADYHDDSIVVVQHTPRFRIRRLREPVTETFSAQPWVLRDREAPAFLGRAETFEQIVEKMHAQARALGIFVPGSEEES